MPFGIRPDWSDRVRHFDLTLPVVLPIHLTVSTTWGNYSEQSEPDADINPTQADTVSR